MQIKASWFIAGDSNADIDSDLVRGLLGPPPDLQRPSGLRHRRQLPHRVSQIRQNNAQSHGIL